jgi:hypothetical protein
MNAARRELRFSDLDAVVADVKNLQARGYERAGNWNLAQVCGHLALWMSYSIDGYPKPGLVIGGVLWLMKISVGGRWKRKMLESGTMASGKPTMPSTVPSAEADAAAEANRLSETVRRFKGYLGDIHPSPLFGALTRDEATRLQLIHSAHHLSFLVPKQ